MKYDRASKKYLCDCGGDLKYEYYDYDEDDEEYYECQSCNKNISMSTYRYFTRQINYFLKKEAELDEREKRILERENALLNN